MLDLNTHTDKGFFWHKKVNILWREKDYSHAHERSEDTSKTLIK